MLNALEKVMRKERARAPNRTKELVRSDILIDGETEQSWQDQTKQRTWQSVLGKTYMRKVTTSPLPATHPERCFGLGGK
jgi:hypothetical protein